MNSRQPDSALYQPNSECGTVSTFGVAASAGEPTAPTVGDDPASSESGCLLGITTQVEPSARSNSR